MGSSKFDEQNLVKQIAGGDLSAFDAYFGSNPIDQERLSDQKGRKPEKIRKAFHKALEKGVAHDEPWLTLIALYSLLGPTAEAESGSPQLEALNDALRSAWHPERQHPLCQGSCRR